MTRDTTLLQTIFISMQNLVSSSKDAGENLDSRSAEEDLGTICSADDSIINYYSLNITFV